MSHIPSPHAFLRICEFCSVMQEVQDMSGVDFGIDFTNINDSRITSSCFTAHDIFFDITFQTDYSCEPPRRGLLEYSCESPRGYDGDTYGRETTMTFDRAYFVAAAIRYLHFALSQEKNTAAGQDVPWTRSEK